MIAVMCMIPVLLMGCGVSQDSKENKESQSISDEGTDNNATASTENLPIATIEVDGFGILKVYYQWQDLKILIVQEVSSLS